MRTTFRIPVHFIAVVSMIAVIWILPGFMTGLEAQGVQGPKALEPKPDKPVPAKCIVVDAYVTDIEKIANRDDLHNQLFQKRIVDVNFTSLINASVEKDCWTDQSDNKLARMLAAVISRTKNPEK